MRAAAVQSLPARDIMTAMRARSTMRSGAREALGAPRRSPDRRGSRRRTGVLVAVAALLGGAAAVPSWSVAQQADEGFSAEERRRLASGELVTRPVERQRGQRRLIGGSSWQVVNQPPEVTWRALCDTDAYPHMLPSTRSVDVVAHRPGQRTVRIRHEVGFVSARYHLRMDFDHERRDVSFRLDAQRPNDLRAAWGFLAVSAYEDDPDRSLVSYGVMADPGGGMLGGVIRPQIHEWILRVPQTIRTYLNGSGGRRYGA